MQSKPINEIEVTKGGNHPYNNSSTPVCGEPWWKIAGYNSVMRASGSNSSSLEPSVESDGGFNEEDEEATKDSADPSSEGNYQQGHHAASNVPPTNDESITQTPQLKLVSHSIACASNPYCDPYYGGMMAAYGQPLVYPPHILDMHHHPRVALPLEMAPEPVFVNAKQYNGILRRRQSRAKAELEKKLIKDRKPYLHESRHQHAMRRARASGGRFAKKSNNGDDSSKNTSQENTNSGRCENNSNNASSSSSAYGGERGDQQQQQWGSAQRAVAMQ
jgi:nuclear transcription factor Y alpha